MSVRTIVARTIGIIIHYHCCQHKPADLDSGYSIPAGFPYRGLAEDGSGCGSAYRPADPICKYNKVLLLARMSHVTM